MEPDRLPAIQGPRASGKRRGRGTRTSRRLGTQPSRATSSFVQKASGMVAALALTTFFAGLVSFGTSGNPLALQAMIHSAIIGITALMVAGRQQPEDTGATLFLAVDWIRGSLVVVLDAMFGPPEVTFRSVVSSELAIEQNGAALLFSLAMSIGIIILPKGRQFRREASEKSSPGVGFENVLLLAGIVGLGLRFHSPGSALSYLSGSYEELSRTAEGPVGFLGSILRTMLPIGFLLKVSHEGRSATEKVFWGVLLSPLVLLALASFALNRAALLFPIIAICLAFWSGRQRIRLTAVTALGGTVGVAFLVLGAFRSNQFNLEGGRNSSASTASAFEGVRATLETYGQSPFLTGVLSNSSVAERIGWEQVLSSVLSPVPLLGQNSRAESSTSIYNYAIYGRSSVVDQIIPTWAEVDAAFGVLGLLVFGMGWVLLMRRLSRLVSEPQIVTRYASLLGLIWCAQAPIASLQALCQAGLYSVIPALVVALVLRKSHFGRPAGQRARGSGGLSKGQVMAR